MRSLTPRATRPESFTLGGAIAHVLTSSVSRQELLVGALRSLGPSKRRLRRPDRVGTQPRRRLKMERSLRRVLQGGAASLERVQPDLGWSGVAQMKEDGERADHQPMELGPATAASPTTSMAATETGHRN